MRTSFLIVVPAVVGHILLPMSLLSRLWRTTDHDLPTWLAASFFAASYFAFMYVAGAWSWFGSLCRHVLPVLLILAVWRTYPGGRGKTIPTPLVSVESVAQSVLGTAFTAMTTLALRGRKARAPVLDLAFPLRGGTFQVGQGGASRAVNYHFSHPSQRYALDVLSLNRLGIRAQGIYPRQPQRYAIWGAEIVSPCDGVVMAAVDGFPDSHPRIAIRRIAPAITSRSSLSGLPCIWPI